jgi:2-polyprenyl-6-methoxyphenol hydroxylase-like FAD-dependent oxidoreductase
MKAVVIGGSLGGLFAANLLVRAGWDVTLYERTGEQLSGRGAGIVTHAELNAALARAGCVVDETLGVPVPGRVTLARDGSVEAEKPLPQVLTAWGRLYHLLKAAFPPEHYRFGRTLARIEQDADSATAVFSDGARDRADLLVAADGIRSTVRAQLAPEARPRYAGYIAWRGLVDEAALSPATHAALFERFAFCLPAREQMLGYPVAGANNSTRPGERRWNFVWYRPADEATVLRDMLTDRDGRTYEGNIPLDRIRPDVVTAMLAEAERVLSPQFCEVVRKTEQPFFQPIYDLESERLAFGRVALVGDAAFVARPHCGMGVTKAGGDAVALVDALAAGKAVPEALRDYERARQPFGTFIVGYARKLGAYMQAQVLTQAEREAAEAYRSTAAIMRETAVAPEAT